MEATKSNLWISPFLVGGAALEAVLLNLTTWGALVLPGLCALVWSLLQPNMLILGLLLFRPLLELWREATLDLPGVGSLNLAALAGLLVIASMLFNLFRTTVAKRTAAYQPVLQDRLFSYWVLFLAYTLFVSLVFSPNVNNSLLEFFRLISIPAVYWLSKKFVGMDWRDPLRPLQMLLFSSLVPVAFGLHQFFTSAGIVDFEVQRVYSFFGNPVAYSQYLTLVVTAGTVLAVYYRAQGRRMLVGGYLALVFFAQAVTYGKGGWVGTAVALMVLGLVYQGKQIKVRNILVSALAVFVLGFTLLELLPGAYDFVARMWKSDSVEGSSLATRLAIWAVVWPAFLDNPLFGCGLSGGQVLVDQAWGVAFSIHNDYLRLLVDSGILGLALYLHIQILLYRHLREARHRLSETDRRLKALVAAAMALQASYLVMITVDNLITSLLINYPLWIMAGAVRGYHERAIQADSDAPAEAT